MGHGDRTGDSTIDQLNQGAWEIALSNPAGAKEMILRLLDLAERSGDDKRKAQGLLNLAWCEFYLSHLDAAEKAASQAAEYFDRFNDLVGLSMVFLNLGAVEKERGELDQALDRTMKAVELSQAVGRKDREAAALNNVGEVLMESGEIQEALNYFMQAVSAMREIREGDLDFFKPIELESNLFANIGQAFIQIGEDKNAQGYLELARGAAEAAGDVGAEIRSLKGLAISARREGRRDTARELLSQALSRSTQASQVVYSVEIQIEMAIFQIEENSYPRAIELLNTAMGVCEREGLKRKLAECYRYRSLAFEASHQFSEALLDFKQFHEVMDSISVDLIARSKKQAEIRFDLEKAKQEAEIYRLRNVELKERQNELERTNARLQAVMEIGQVITASLDLETVAQRIHESISQLMDTTGFTLVVYHESTKDLEFTLFIQGGQRIETLHIPADSDESFAAYVIRHNKPIRLNNVDQEYKDYIRSRSLAFGIETPSLIYVPLSLAGRIVGALGVQSVQRGAYTDEDVQLLMSLGSFIAVAIENSRTHSELVRLNEELKSEKDSLEKLARKVSRIANHDGLTGLPNRLLLGELLEKALHRAKRLSTLLAVLFMDLDDFKPINDRFGHHAGDQALIEVSRRLKSALRESDVVARVGGDEFVAFTQDLDDRDSARVVAEKLEEALKTPILVNGVPCSVGVSIGIALYPGDGKTADDLLRKADESMYRIKRTGKNGFIFFEDIDNSKNIRL
jgi:diguanylate cyclase (GGDEF)-like protein